MVDCTEHLQFGTDLHLSMSKTEITEFFKSTHYKCNNRFSRHIDECYEKDNKCNLEIISV
jgi:hypothetical protein